MMAALLFVVGALVLVLLLCLAWYVLGRTGMDPQLRLIVFLIIALVATAIFIYGSWHWWPNAVVVR